MNGNTSFEVEASAEAEIGTIVILKKDGVDSGTYPMLEGTGPWKFGQNPDCDLRIKVIESDKSQF